MCTITARDFRQNMKTVLDRVSAGEDIVISRGSEFYLISPVQIKPVVTLEMEAKLEAARSEIERGECVTLSSIEDIDSYFASL